MVFASGVFLYVFLPLFLLIYFVAPRSARSFIIAAASYVFYGWWRPDFVLLILASTVIDYVCGGSIARARERGRKGRRWLLTSLTANLGLLAYFKYANFGVETLNGILTSQGVDAIEWTAVVLPAGISFYTFQTISYSIDIYTGRSVPVRRFGDIMCYVALFPQLIAGPIVRYHTIAEQLRSRTHTLDKFYRGVLFFQMGLAKKVLIADIVGVVADQAFSAESLPIYDHWIGIVAYAFQIYFDFSAYSDMAIGLGLMMGFRFPINFDRPYRSVSITQFWQRWHISLSSFLRDYLYIPLGGNRRGPVRTYVNLCLTFLLGGLWHGANWTFIAWGAYQGFWLCVERANGRRPFYARTPLPVQVALTFVLALFGWVLFRADSLPEALTFAGGMVGVGTSELASPVLQVRPIHFLAGAAAMICVWSMPTSQRLIARSRPLVVLALQVFFWLALTQLFFVEHVPFLYSQF